MRVRGEDQSYARFQIRESRIGIDWRNNAGTFRSMRQVFACDGSLVRLASRFNIFFCGGRLMSEIHQTSLSNEQHRGCHESASSVVAALGLLCQRQLQLLVSAALLLVLAGAGWWTLHTASTNFSRAVRTARHAVKESASISRRTVPRRVPTGTDNPSVFRLHR